MEIAELLELARRWEKLGWSVQGQLQDVVEGNEKPEHLNPQAMKLAAQFLVICKRRGVNGAASVLDDIDRALKSSVKAS